MKKLYLFLSLFLLAFCGNIAAQQGTGTVDDPFIAENLATVKSGAAGTWYLVDLSGMKVSFKQGNDVYIEDETAGLVFIKTSITNKVNIGDKITSGKIKLVCDTHSKSVWVNGSNNDIVVVEDIATETGTSVAKEVTTDEFTSENWGRYIKVKGKVVSEDNGKGGFNYYINKAGVRANRISLNYTPCKNEIANIADNDKEYYIYGVLLSDYFRGISFEDASQEPGTEGNPIKANSLADARNLDNAGKWMIIDLAGTQVSININNEVFIQDANTALVFTKVSEVRTKVKTGDKITAGKIKVLVSAHNSKANWINGSNGATTVLENIKTEPGTLDAIELTPDELTDENNWGRYVKIMGKITEDNTRYYVNGVRIYTNYYKTLDSDNYAGNNKVYYVYGVLLSDGFRALSFAEIPSVTVTENKYTTYVTPCAVDFGNEVKAYIVNEVTADKVKTVQVSNAPEGTPVIVYAENAGTYTLTEIEAATDDVESNKLLASDGTITGGNNIYAMAVKRDVAGFYKVKETVTIPAGKAYLVWGDATANSKEFIPIGGETTGITSVTGEEGNDRKVYYNLNGMRVDNPQKGIYIVNGKKVIF